MKVKSKKLDFNVNMPVAEEELHDEIFETQNSSTDFDYEELKINDANMEIQEIVGNYQSGTNQKKKYGDS